MADASPDPRAQPDYSTTPVRRGQTSDVAVTKRVPTARFVLLCALAAGFVLVGAAAAPCAANDADPSPPPAAATAALEVFRPVGDVYNERTSDGDAYPQSFGARGYASNGTYAVWLDYRRNVYLTESAGAGSLTHYPRLEGGYGSQTPFLARDSSFETRFERNVGIPTVFAGIGYDRTWENYHYPDLHGLGLGLEKRATNVPGLRPFGSAFYYPSTTGSYVTETLPARELAPHFRILKLDYGFRYQVKAPVYFVFDYGNEFRRANGIGAQIRFIRSDVTLGLGVHL